MTHPARNIWNRAWWLLLPASSQLVLIYPLSVEMGKWEPLAWAAAYIATSTLAVIATFIIWLIRKRKRRAQTCEKPHTSAATSPEKEAGKSQSDKPG